MSVFLQKKTIHTRGGEKILAEFWRNVLTNLLQNVKFQHLLHPWEPTGHLVSLISHTTLLSYSFKSNHFETNLLRQAQSSSVFLVSPWASVNLTELEHIFNQQRWTWKRHQRRHCSQAGGGTRSLPGMILEVTRDTSMERGGRAGVDVFVLLVLFLSDGLLIFERGAKMPE